MTDTKTKKPTRMLLLNFSLIRIIDPNNMLKNLYKSPSTLKSNSELLYKCKYSFRFDDSCYINLESNLNVFIDFLFLFSTNHVDRSLNYLYHDQILYINKPPVNLQLLRRPLYYVSTRTVENIIKLQEIIFRKSKKDNVYRF